MSVKEAALGLFEGYGVEIEYMVVDARKLDVLPITDRLIESVPGAEDGDVDRGEIVWSNELAGHVIEVKTARPVDTLVGVADSFERNVAEMNQRLAPLGGRLMPTGMHPWMDPVKETRLWTKTYKEVYETFDRIFDCRRHGWSNLQSVHLNLPFAGARQFGQLHAAVRLVLPILPGLAASSPMLEGNVSGWLDTRLEVYRHNSQRVPSIAGRVIPEPVYSPAEYRERILKPIFADVAALDPEGILRSEWLNARGAIARFDRGSIEIRLLDTQECPAADLAICAAVAAVARRLVADREANRSDQREWPIAPLEKILVGAIRDADEAVIDDPAYLELFHFPGWRATVGELWHHLIETDPSSPESADSDWRADVRNLLRRGPLARRILRALNGDVSRERVRDVYRDLCDCLATGQAFEA